MQLGRGVPVPAGEVLLLPSQAGHSHPARRGGRTPQGFGCRRGFIEVFRISSGGHLQCCSESDRASPTRAARPGEQLICTAVGDFPRVEPTQSFHMLPALVLERSSLTLPACPSSFLCAPSLACLLIEYIEFERRGSSALCHLIVIAASIGLGAVSMNPSFPPSSPLALLPADRVHRVRAARVEHPLHLLLRPNHPPARGHRAPVQERAPQRVPRALHLLQVRGVTWRVGGCHCSG